MTRGEALKRLAEPPFEPENIAHDFEFVASKLGMTVDELQACMDGPNRSYRDFASQQWIYTIGRRAMQMLGLERGGKR
jgi:hypothetical protein